jgi:hypothetical protein
MNEAKMKTVKVELTFERDDGSRFTKTLKGADAQQWQGWVNSICTLAWAHGDNPPWDQLRWVEKELKDLPEIDDVC